MSIVTTTAVLGLLKLIGNKSLEGAFQNVGSKVSDKAMQWLKSLFYKDNGEPKSALLKAKENPNSKENQVIIKALIENDIEDDSSKESLFKEIIESLPKSNSIENYKNVNTGVINSNGGDVNLGDRYGK